MTAATYTLDEARIALRRLECAAERHPPTGDMSTLRDPAGVFVCRCGLFTYRGTPTVRPSTVAAS